jgi:hypothetical protein
MRWFIKIEVKLDLNFQRFTSPKSKQTVFSNGYHKMLLDQRLVTETTLRLKTFRESGDEMVEWIFFFARTPAWKALKIVVWTKFISFGGRILECLPSSHLLSCLRKTGVKNHCEKGKKHWKNPNALAKPLNSFRSCLWIH